MRAIPLVAVVALLAVQHLGPAPAAAETFTNSAPIVIVGLGPTGPLNTPATPYPSDIAVSGMSGTITDVNLTFNDLDCSDVGNDFAYPEDFDILLESPSGDNAVVFSDLGGGNDEPPIGQFPAIDVTLDDQAANPVPADTSIQTDPNVFDYTYQPVDDDNDPGDRVPTDTFPAAGQDPANPAVFITPSGATALSTFDGEDPNGTWSLYVVDDFPGPDNCEISSGWTLDILTGGGGGTTTTAPPATTTTTAPTTTTTGPNSAPVAVDDAYTTPQNTPLVVAAPGVLANDSDPDGDPLTAGMPTNPSSGTLNLSTNGGFTYTPNTGFSGTDTFTYMAHDPFGGMTTATVTVTVSPSATTTTSTPATTTTSTPATTTTSTPATTTTSTPATTTTSTPATTTTSTPATTTTSTPATTTTSTPATTTTAPPATTTTAPPATTTTVVTPPDGPIEIDDSAQSNGDIARFTGMITCDEGNRYRIEVMVTQGETHAMGVATGNCTGDPQRFRVIAHVMSGPGLEDGTAQVEATAEIGDPSTRTIVDTFSASEDVEIEIPAGMAAAMLSAIESADNPRS